MSRPESLLALLVVTGLCAVAGVTTMRAGASTSSATFAASADAAVYADSPTTNRGTSQVLYSRGGTNPHAETYLRFDVSGLTGTVQSAVVRLTTQPDPTVDGPAIYPTSSSWSETGITWNNRPAETGPASDDKGALGENQVVDYNVTGLVSGNGTFSFKLASTSNDGVTFFSREAPSNLSPSLIVTVSSSSTGSDTRPPSASVSSPANGNTVSGNLTVTASASDDVGVTRVDFLVDGQTKGSDASSPWSYVIDTTTLSNGSHTVGVRAYDGAGNASPASSVTVTVSNTSTVPASTSCNLYASPSGSSSASGTSPSSPLTLAAAAGKTQPGTTVCLLAGTYTLSSPWYISRSGAPGKYVTYRSYNGTPTLKWTGGQDTMVGVPSGKSYIEFNGLTIDAANSANSDINCNTANHIRVIGNTLLNGGGAGFSSYHCDYMVVDRNRIYHAGYATGWSSAISLNTDVWVDSAAGFHDVITNNIISGSYDNSSYHTDGNGIIIDSGGNVPPVLIANNIVYENYFRCIHSLNVQHVWVINNTCYKNGLRYNPSNDIAGEINTSGSTDVHVINNVAYAWTTPHPYQQIQGSSVVYQHNVAFGGTTSVVPSGVLSDTSQIRSADPRFSSPPSVDATASGQWANAVPPWQIGTALKPQSGSPLIGQGIDPHNATGMTSALQSGLDQYLTTDVTGAPRVQGGAWDIGAYES